MNSRSVKVPADNEVAALKDAKIMSLDIETKDPELPEKGPGTHRGVGYICGASVGMDEGNVKLAYYLPINHPDIGVDIATRSNNILEDLLLSNNHKLGTNIIYDLEWLQHSGYKVNGGFHDVQYAEPLLDEYRGSYKLEKLAKIYTSEVKKTNVLEEYNDTMGWKEKPIKNIWRMPSTIAEEYALPDATLPLEIFKKQKIMLEKQNLWDLYVLETKLMPLLLQMRKNGVRLDMPKLQKTIMHVTDLHFNLKESLHEWAGKEFNPAASGQLAKVFDEKGIAYPRNEPTEKMAEKGLQGNPKLDKDSLTRMEKRHPICAEVLQYKHYDTMINLFLHPYLDFQVNGRLYGSFHPLRSDDYGTVSGRFSASKPNLQQVSAKDEDDFSEDTPEYEQLKGQMIRELFIPEDGCKWAKCDYSQIEYRIMAHYATGRGSQVLRDRYNNDPKTDFHKYIEKSQNVSRRIAKRLNFGGAYGMGVATAAYKFGWTIEEAEHFINNYHAKAPYVKKTRALVSKTAARRGYIYTILGRKARVHMTRSLYSMFNRLIQGSAADIMKKGMVDAYEKGVFEVLIPHLTVHDEMDVSYVDNKIGNEALRELTQTMEDTVKLDVPVMVDCHTGNNWAEAD